ncbi:MAG TPA: LysM peptidoglycan-binding domain-containing protein [Candidatus Saccharimonadales bacterium]|nr:LysM peptidoglycan-binding domain-containing protein [Candidatus Saccharimonadales bacterium]
MNYKTTRRRVIKWSLVGLNVGLLLLAGSFILFGSRNSGAISPSILSTTSSATPVNPLDQLSSAEVAVTVARLDALPETTAITNQADSEQAELTIVPTSSNVVAKPQVVATKYVSNKDIHHYTTVAGDTITSVAAKFGVTSDSIRWSNGLVGNTLTVGQNLAIPPADGIVYTVKAGDTPESLAQKFRTDKDKIIQANDAEKTGLKLGDQIIIPDGTQTPVVARLVAYGFPWGGSAIYGYNGYDYGYCTWYVANRIAVPSNWGNANTWDNLAPLSGWTVSGTPRVGAIGQTDRGWAGHVAFVEAVSEDGSQIKYSDMNGLAGWGRIGYSGWVSASYYPHYIYR